MIKPEIVIDGHWLSTIMPWGDLEWTTCWPGGTESISFGVARDHRLFRPDARVELDYGGIRLALGALVEPTRGEPLMAEGLHRQGEDYAALMTATGEVAPTVHDAVDQARSRGLPWIRLEPGYVTEYDLSPEPFVDGTPDLDLDRPHSVAQYLDASAQRRGQQWGVDPYARVIMTGWQAASRHMLPGVDGLAISRDGYASVLHGRYLDSTTSTFRTRTDEDVAASARWGRVERTITEPLAEGKPITEARAQELLIGLLVQGRTQMGWATPLEVQYGDVVNEHQQPVDLNRIYARQTIRLHGLDLDIADLSGQTWIDMPIARTHHKGGTVLIEPRGLSQPMNDALAGVA